MRTIPGRARKEFRRMVLPLVSGLAFNVDGALVHVGSPTYVKARFLITQMVAREREQQIIDSMSDEAYTRLLTLSRAVVDAQDALDAFVGQYIQASAKAL